MNATEMIEETLQIANTIKSQIGVWPLAEVGARDFLAYHQFALAGEDYPMPGIQFDAKPRHRIVTVRVLLDPSDTYIVRVSNRNTGAVMYRLDNVYCDDLATVIRTLAEHV
jgi:hypothetical protein